MRYICSLVFAALLLAPLAMLQAGGHGQCTDGCCEGQCPQCNHTCKFSVDTDKEAKNCYSSKCEPICIPKVVFPWQKKPACTSSCGGCADGCTSCAGGACCGEVCSSVNNGACVRHVNKLKKFEYECEVCKYKWEAIRACGSGCGSCNGALPANEAPATPAMEPTPAEQDMLPPAPPPVTRTAPRSEVRQTSGILNFFD